MVKILVQCLFKDHEFEITVPDPNQINYIEMKCDECGHYGTKLVREISD